MACNAADGDVDDIIMIIVLVSAMFKDNAFHDASLQ